MRIAPQGGAAAFQVRSWCCALYNQGAPAPQGRGPPLPWPRPRPGQLCICCIHMCMAQGLIFEAARPFCLRRGVGKLSADLLVNHLTFTLLIWDVLPHFAWSTRLKEVEDGFDWQHAAAALGSTDRRPGNPLVLATVARWTTPTARGFPYGSGATFCSTAPN